MSDLFQFLRTRATGETTLLIVPSGLWARDLPRRLAEAGIDTFDVRVLTPAELAQQVGEPVLLSRGRLPMGSAGWLVLARDAADASLSEDPFGDEARARPGFASVLAQTVQTLRHHAITPQALEDAASDAAEHYRPRLSALAVLYRQMEAQRTASGRYDERDLFDALLSRLQDTPEVWTETAIAWAGHHPGWGLPGDLCDGLDALHASAGRPMPPRFPEPFGTDTDGADALSSLKANLFTAPGNGAFDVTVDLLPCPGEAAEVREALRFAGDRASAGVPLRNQALVLTSADPYGGLVESQAASAWNGLAMDQHAGESLARTRAGRALLGLMDLVGTDLPAPALFDLMAAGQVSVQRSSRFVESLPDEEDRKVSAHRLQDIARKARVVDGDDWADRLGAWADREEEKVDAGTDKGVASWRHKRARLARALSAACQQLREALGRMDGDAPLHEHFASAAALLDPWVGRGADTAITEAMLQELQNVPASSQVVPWDDARLLIAEAVGSRSAPGSGDPDGLMTAGIEEVAGLPYDSAFIVGLAERSYPPPPRRDALLPDEVRRALSIPDSAAENERRKALFGATVRAVRSAVRLSYPAVESNDARPRVPSSFGVSVEEAVLGTIPDMEARLAIRRVGEDPSRALDLTEHWLGRLLADPRPNRDALLRSRSDLLERVNLRRRRWGPKLSAWDGVVPAALAQAALAKRGALGVTAYENYAKCPFDFFVKQLLGLKVLDDPEREAKPDAMQVGIAVHDVLEEYLQLTVQGGKTTLPASTDVEIARLGDICKRRFDALQAERNYGQPAQVAMLAQACTAAAVRWLERSQGQGWYPLALELPFGMEAYTKGSHPAHEIEAGDVTIRIAGRVDRIDAHDADGARELRIIDYKSGKSPRNGKLDERLGHGRSLQLACYASAVAAIYDDPVVAWEYQYLAVHGGPAKPTGQAWDSSAEEELEDILLHLGEAMRSGLFAPGPNATWGDFPLLVRQNPSTRMEITAADPRWSPFREAVNLPPLPETDEEVTP